MFKQIGSFVARYRFAVIAFWIALAVGVTLLALYLGGEPGGHP